MSFKLYNHPEIYDIAFSWDLSREIAFFKGVFETHVPFKVTRLLEPACGSGRFLRVLPEHGFRVTGYDVNPAMVEYAERSVSDAGCLEDARILLADMVSSEIPGEFDAAYNSINSFRYLLSDANVIAHLKATGSSLRENGVYIVHLNLAQDGELPGIGDPGDPWTMERDGIRVETSWEIITEDRKTKLSHEICSFEVEQDDRLEHLEEHHTLRMWLFNDLESLVERSGQFEIVTIYGEDFEELKDRENLSGELGNIYLILKRV